MKNHVYVVIENFVDDEGNFMREPLTVFKSNEEAMKFKATRPDEELSVIGFHVYETAEEYDKEHRG